MLDKVLIYQYQKEIHTFAYSGSKLLFALNDYTDLYGESIFVAKVIRSNHAGKNAFIEYFPGESGFVNLPQERLFQEGSLIPVQLSWFGDQSKQAKFRYGWQLVGKYVVYSFEGPSKVIASHMARDLQVKIRDLANNYPGNWIIRSSCNKLSDIEFLGREMLELSKEALAIKEKVGLGLHYLGVPNYLKLLRSLPLSIDCEVISNNAEINQQLLAKQDLWQIDAITYDPNLFLNNELSGYLDNLKSPVVTLSNGANLEIYTQAGISIIDVNSDKSMLGGSQLNFLVLDAIYQQICLRNLQGIILLDLIKNMTSQQETKIINYLQKLFKNDITKSKVLGFTRAGLCEIIRTRFS